MEKDEALDIGAVDLFCGVGGLTYGMWQSGIRVAAGIDIDESCRYPYEANNQSKFIHKSIIDVTGSEINQLLEGADIRIVVGCAPCQPFSNHRKDKKDRQSHKDWSLLYQFARIIEESLPDIVSMENVPALAKEVVFKDFLAILDKHGYNTCYSIVNAQHYGIAQSRRRLLLLASKSGSIGLQKPVYIKSQICVRDAIGMLPKIDAGEVDPIDRMHQACCLSRSNLERIRASIPNGTWNDWPKELRLECHEKNSGKTYSAVYGRMSWEGIAPTITTQFISYGTGRFGHPSQDRALSLREGALLQSFPANYKFIRDNEQVNKKRIARQIGNAVPPILGKVIGNSILESITDMQ